MSLFAQRRAEMKKKEQNNNQTTNLIKVSETENQDSALMSFPESFKVYESKKEEIKEIKQKKGTSKKSELGKIGVGD